MATSAERYCNEEPNKIKHHRIPHNSKDLRHQRNPRALNPPDRADLKSVLSVRSVGDQSKNQKLPQKFGSFTENPYICKQ